MIRIVKRSTSLQLSDPSPNRTQLYRLLSLLIFKYEMIQNTLHETLKRMVWLPGWQAGIFPIFPLPNVSINHAAWSQLGSDWTGGNDLQHPAQPSPNIYTGQGSSRTSHWRADLHSAVVVEFSNLDRNNLGKSLLQLFYWSMEYNTQRRAGRPLWFCCLHTACGL